MLLLQFSIYSERKRKFEKITKLHHKNVICAVKRHIYIEGKRKANLSSILLPERRVLNMGSRRVGLVGDKIGNMVIGADKTNRRVRVKA